MNDILKQLQSGEITLEQAELALSQWYGREQEADLQFARVDLARAKRRGRPETIFCEGKTPDQICTIAGSLMEAGQTVLMTRLNPDNAEELRAMFAGQGLEEDRFEHFPICRLARIVAVPAQPKHGIVAVLTGGTTDIPVAEEAAIVAETFGSPVMRVYDVGVAGLHRLLRRLPEIRRARVIIAVAGMEGALPSVVAGLVEVPVIAVPTSVGYGANFQGLSALLTMLSSCAPGIATVNIGNGYGAGYLADQINGLSSALPQDS